MREFEFGVINSRAPVRLDFGGGPTDVAPFPDKEKGFVVNAAIQHYAYTRLKRRNDSHIVIASHDFNTKEEFKSVENISIDGPLRLIKSSLLYLKPDHGLEIETKVEVPSGSGLGTSAAVAVALLGALRADLGDQVPDSFRLVKDSLYLENVLLKNINGGQDQYASALGGFHSFVFEKNNVLAKPLEVATRTIMELEERSVLFYSGVSRISGKILTQIMKKFESGDRLTTDALLNIRNTAEKIEKALITGDIQVFGPLIQTVFENQKKLHPNLVTPEINRMFSIALQNGAESGKVTGAGGGGCVYFFCKPFQKQSVITALSKEGFPPISINFSKDGVTVWFS